MSASVLAALFVMGLVAPAATSILIVVTCRDTTRMWVVGTVTEVLVLGVTTGTIVATFQAGWWRGVGPMCGFVVICVVACVANALGFIHAGHLMPSGVSEDASVTELRSAS